MHNTTDTVNLRDNNLKIFERTHCFIVRVLQISIAVILSDTLKIILTIFFDMKTSWHFKFLTVWM